MYKRFVFLRIIWFVMSLFIGFHDMILFLDSACSYLRCLCFFFTTCLSHCLLFSWPSSPLRVPVVKIISARKHFLTGRRQAMFFSMAHMGTSIQIRGPFINSVTLIFAFSVFREISASCVTQFMNGYRRNTKIAHFRAIFLWCRYGGAASINITSHEKRTFWPLHSPLRCTMLSTKVTRYVINERHHGSHFEFESKSAKQLRVYGFFKCLRRLCKILVLKCTMRKNAQ